MLIQLPRINNRDYIDLEEQTPQLFNEIYFFIDNFLSYQCDESCINVLRECIVNLENIYIEELTQGIVTVEQIDDTNNNLLILLNFTYNSIINSNITINKIQQDIKFSSYKFKFLDCLIRQQNIIQRFLKIDSPEAERNCKFYTNVLISIYIIIMILALISTLIANFAIEEHNKKLEKISEFMMDVSIITISLPVYCIWAIVLFAHICGPCINDCTNYKPENSRIREGKIIVNTIFNIFNTNLPRSIDYFKKNPTELPRNTQEIACKLWILYVNSLEVLSIEMIQSVLLEYAEYLETHNYKFAEEVQNNFIDNLLNINIDPYHQLQVRNFIDYSLDTTKEMTVEKAIMLVNDSLVKKQPKL